MNIKSVDIIKFFVNLFGLALTALLTELPYALVTKHPTCDNVAMVIIQYGAAVSAMHVFYCITIFKVNIFFDRKEQRQRELLEYLTFPALQFLLLVFITVSESFFLYHSACGYSLFTQIHRGIGGNP